MAFYKLADYPAGVKVFSNMKKSSPYYDIALYYLGQSLLRMERVNVAIDVSQRLLALPQNTERRRRLSNETHLTLGYLYFELGYFSEAIAECHQVKENSNIHPNALLATGWSFANLELWSDAISPLTQLYTNYEFHPVTPEGLFLLGRCYLKINRYNEAIQIYDHLISIFPDTSDVITKVKQVNETIKLEKNRIKKRRMELLIVESTLSDRLEQGADSRTTESLLRKVHEERLELAQRLERVDNLATLTAMQEERRNWRVYAEYGKTRALFLKRQQDRRRQPVGSSE